MTTLKVTDYDEGGLYCTNCDSHFNLTWNKHEWISQVDYCPFCGEEVEEIIYD